KARIFVRPVNPVVRFMRRGTVIAAGSSSDVCDNMKWLKRILVAMVTLLLVLGALALTARHLAHRRPDWYPAAVADAKTIQAAAQSVKNKFVGVQTWAAESHASELTRKSGRPPVPTDPTTPQAAKQEISLTE